MSQEQLFAYHHEDGHITTYRTIPSTPIDADEIPTAIGAGTSRGMNVVVYQDVNSGMVFFRSPEDFQNRMRKVTTDPKQIPDGSIGRLHFYGLAGDKCVSLPIDVFTYKSIHFLLASRPKSHGAHDPIHLPPLEVGDVQRDIFVEHLRPHIVAQVACTNDAIKDARNDRFDMVMELVTPDGNTIGMWNLTGARIYTLDCNFPCDIELSVTCFACRSIIDYSEQYE